jgi:TolB-like protein
MGDTAVQPVAAPAALDLCIGDWLVQPTLGVVSRRGVATHLEPKAIEVLVCLAQRAGTVVSKEELISTVWAGTFVTDHVLTHAIWQLRQVFGESVRLETIPRRGYRLAETVRPYLAPIRSLAVLPLNNFAQDPAQEYFVDGMTDALITQLAQIRALRVISRTSSMQYKSARKPLSQIAQELKVDGVIEGSVMRVADSVRISVQLIRVATDEHLWARSYEGSIRDVFALQDEVARDIATVLQVQLNAEVQQRPAPTRPVKAEAHEAYLKARYCWNFASPESVKASVAYFEEAIRLDPDFALAYTGLADVYATMTSPIMATIAPAEGVGRIRPAAERALQLEPALADAHQALAWLKHYYDWDWDGAEQAYGRVLSLNPNCSVACAGRAILLGGLQRYDEALRDLEQACRLDPLSLLWNTIHGWTWVLAGRPVEGSAQLHRTLSLDARFWFAHEVLALALLAQGKGEDAVASATTAVSLSGGMSFPVAVLGHVYGMVGQREPAARVLHQLEKATRDAYVAPSLLAFVCKGLGQKDRAFEYLESAYAVRDTGMIWMKSVWQDWSGEPRYQELVSRMKFPA